MLDPWIDDFEFIEAARRSETEKRNRKQYARTCNVCEQDFASGNKLFKHLDVYPDHMASKYDISYTLCCRICAYNESGWLNKPQSHDVRVGKNLYQECGPLFVESILIEPYQRRDLSYEIKTNSQVFGNLKYDV